LDFPGLVTVQKPCPVTPTLEEPQAAGNTQDVDVDQQLLGKSAGGDSLPDVSHPVVPLLDVPLPDVTPHDGLLPEPRPDGSLGEE